jgi:hypothetical protein
MKDKQELVLNPITGKLDMVQIFNENRIVTHSNFSTGNQLQIYDPKSGAFVDMGFLIVTDEEGNVITT